MPAAAVTALVDFSILPLWWELFLVPVVTVLFLISELGYSLSVSREDGRPIVGIAKALLIVYLVALIWLAAKGVFQNPNTWGALVQTFWVPAFLTVGTLPYLKLVLFPLESALYRISVSPVNHSHASRNPELEVAFWYQQIYLETILVMVGEKMQFDLSAGRKAVRSEDYGSSWPLTVDSATLCCKSGAVWVEVDGKKYGFNGLSKSILPRCGHASFNLEEIWREHPEGMWKVDISPLIRDGLALEWKR